MSHPAYTARRYGCEIAIVLLVSFGLSGLRSLLRLIDALLAPAALSEQSAVLYSSQAQASWLDIALQVCSALMLCAWAALAGYLLWSSGDWRWHGVRNHLPDAAAWRHGAALAALIGIPGLGLYVLALHMGWSKQVIPTSMEESWWEVPVLLLYSLANAIAEEVVVVTFLLTRLRQMRVPWGYAIGASAVLRGSYHLYQGVSAGFGNIIMGLIFAAYYAKTGKVWPLILGHFLIDAVAFVGYAAGAGSWSFLQA